MKLTAVEVISITIAVISLLIAIYQTITMEKTKKANIALKQAYEQKCASRVIKLGEIADDIVKSDMLMCQIVGRFCLKKEQVCRKLAAKVDQSVGFSHQLVHFCDDLNKEHEIEFGHLADLDLSNKLHDSECITLSAEDFAKL